MKVILNVLLMRGGEESVGQMLLRFAINQSTRDVSLLDLDLH